MTQIINKTKQAHEEYLSILVLKTKEIEMALFLGNRLGRTDFQKINNQFLRIVKGVSNTPISTANLINVKDI